MSSSTSFIVIGDLHYDPDFKHVFEKGFQQFHQHSVSALIQLGDQGGYHYPGSKASFLDAKEIFDLAPAPLYTLMGNHDLEGDEFNSDEDSRQAWCEVFQRQHVWESFDIGPHLGISLSSWNFRTHPHCPHQVNLGAEQYAWLQEILKQNRDRTTFIFCHVPIISSGLISLLTPHLAAPNAFLDQTENPFKYDQLLADNPQVRLWFSGHNHLGHSYKNAITKRHACYFIHTGTMSTFTRDNLRQSRHIEFSDQKIDVSTIDHNTGNFYKDTTIDLHSGDMTHHQAFHSKALDRHPFTPSIDSTQAIWQVKNSLFQWHHDHLVEFDQNTQWPLGVVYRGHPLETRTNHDSLLLLTESEGIAELKANPTGRFFRPYMPSDEYHLAKAPLPLNWLEG